MSLLSRGLCRRSRISSPQQAHGSSEASRESDRCSLIRPSFPRVTAPASPPVQGTVEGCRHPQSTKSASTKKGPWCSSKAACSSCELASTADVHIGIEQAGAALSPSAGLGSENGSVPTSDGQPLNECPCANFCRAGECRACAHIISLLVTGLLVVGLALAAPQRVHKWWRERDLMASRPALHAADLKVLC